MEQIPRLAGNTVLIDIDGTITYSEPLAEDPFIGTLRDMLVQTRGLSEAGAMTRIHDQFDPEREDIYDHIAPMGIDPQAYWNTLMSHLKKVVRVFPDAAQMIRMLHRRGFRLFPATTNGRMACLAKLAVGGLADRFGSPFFDDIFGGSNIVPDGKSSPRFFEALVNRIGAKPEEVIVVGDDPKYDLAYAKGAGIGQVVLPRRNQREDWVLDKDGGIYVKSLTVILNMIQKDGK